MGKSKIRNFMDTHPVIGLISLYLTSFIFIQCIGIGIDEIIVRLVWENWPGYICSILFAFLTLWIFRQIFRPDYNGALHLRGTLKGILFMWPIFPLMLLFTIMMNPEQNWKINLLCAFWAGINEEVFARGLPVAFLKYHYNHSKSIPMIVLLTGIIFGLMHLLNILVGGSVSGTLLQALNAGALGMMFAAVFMRTGTIWPAIIVHSVYDFLTFMVKTDSSGTAAGVASSSFSLSSLIILIPVLIYIITAFVLVRPSRREQIMSLWDEKWNANVRFTR